MKVTRRQFFSWLAALPVIGWLSAYSFGSQKTKLQPTPACDDHDGPTPSQTEGPYFKPASPERNNLREQGIKGTILVLSGQVVDTNCKPVAKALLDWWHADNAGEYDNTGFRLRGHHYTDAQGNFRLETIVPGLYPGRTRHLHVKVQAPNKPVLTTQLYFPDDAGNKKDYLFKPILLMATTKGDNKINASYTFVLKT